MNGRKAFPEPTSGRSFKMRKLVTVFIGALFSVALTARAFANTETVTGQLIDLACYVLDKGNTGNAHQGRGYNCARACAKEGFAVGLLTSDGKIYQVTGGLAANSNAKLVPHMSDTVTITGDVTEKEGQMMIAASQLKMIAK
jgi:hypothetical protein